MNKPLKKHLFSSQINLAKFSPASEEEKSQQEVMSESTTFFRDGMKNLLRNPLAVGAIIVLRAALTFLIHWEIKTEEAQMEQELEQKQALIQGGEETADRQQE